MWDSRDQSGLAGSEVMTPMSQENSQLPDAAQEPQPSWGA